MKDNLISSVFPATCIQFPAERKSRRAAFFLAAEEYVASSLPEGNYVFAWRLAPTVVMGRHQVAEREIDLDFCRAEGIDVIRRKSGGGCIYADEGNIMFSLVTKAGAVEPLFAEYAGAVAEGLRKLGAKVEVSGRNDIRLADGGKVCGNAFYHLPDRNIVHGTMLYDTDIRRMTGALTPPESKLRAAGVESVRSRIGLLKDHIGCGIEELQHGILHELCDKQQVLTAADVAAIEEIEKGYYAPEYLYPKTVRAEFSNCCRVEGCGQVELHFTLRSGCITNVDVRGDFFETEDANAAFRAAFCGCPFTPKDLVAAISEHRPQRSIRGLTAEALAALLNNE